MLKYIFVATFCSMTTLSCGGSEKNEETGTEALSPLIARVECVAAPLSNNGLPSGPFIPDENSPSLCQFDGIGYHLNDAANFLNDVADLSFSGTGEFRFGDQALVSNGVFVEFMRQPRFGRHASTTLYIHDGKVRVKELEQPDEITGTQLRSYVWGIYSASFLIELQLGLASGDFTDDNEFRYRDLTMVDVEAIPNESYVGLGLVSIDLDRDNSIGSNDEYHWVSDGSVTISGQRPRLLIKLDLTIDSAKSLVGEYRGDYIDLTDFLR